MNAPRELLELFSLDSKFTLDEGPFYLNGTQALGRLMSRADKPGLPWSFARSGGRFGQLWQRTSAVWSVLSERLMSLRQAMTRFRTGAEQLQEEQMPKVKTISLGKREVSLRTLTGVVAGEKKWSSTEVSGSGGGGYLQNGQGHIDQIKIKSTTTEHQEIFVRLESGQENPLQFQDASLSIREGHDVSILQGGTRASPPAMIALHNHTTRKSNVFWARAQPLFLPLTASSFFCLIAVVIIVYAFASSPFSPFPRVGFFVLGKLNRIGFLIFAATGVAVFIPAFLAFRRGRGLNKVLKDAIQSSIAAMKQQRRGAE